MTTKETIENIDNMIHELYEIKNQIRNMQIDLNMMKSDIDEYKDQLGIEDQEEPVEVDYPSEERERERAMGVL